MSSFGNAFVAGICGMTSFVNGSGQEWQAT